MAEAQRDAYEALSENLAAAQRRGMGLANGGLEFVRLQEDNARAAQEWFANGVKLLRLQQRNAEFVGGWAGDAVEALREQTENNARTAEAFARGVSEQQEGFRALAQQWAGAYRDFFSPFSYARQGMRTFQRATRQGLEATSRSRGRGWRPPSRSPSRGCGSPRRPRGRPRRYSGGPRRPPEQAELRAAVLGALKTDDYDGLTVAEISERLDGLSAEQLRKVREFEKQNKDRETLVGQIDRKIRANS